MIYKNRLLKTIRYNVKATTISPLAIRDDEDNLKIDQLTGKVYIPVHLLPVLLETIMKLY